MGRTFRAARVFQTAKQRLYRRALTPAHDDRTPPWFAALEAIPPSDCVTRPHVPRSRAVRETNKAPHRPPRNLYLPRQLVYEEDELRTTFFRDHPWELARPRIVLELDGKDARYVDWSRGVRQPGMPLSGECVVQRQLWLMHNVEGITKEQAYDEARREFYALRHEEEVERRIAQEEARMVGGVFGKSALQIGMELEDQQYEKWKKWASGEMNRLESERSGAISSYGDDTAAEDDLGTELAKIG